MLLLMRKVNFDGFKYLLKYLFLLKTSRLVKSMIEIESLNSYESENKLSRGKRRGKRGGKRQNDRDRKALTRAIKSRISLLQIGRAHV